MSETNNEKRRDKARQQGSQKTAGIAEVQKAASRESVADRYWKQTSEKGQTPGQRAESNKPRAKPKSSP